MLDRNVHFKFYFSHRWSREISTMWEEWHPIPHCRTVSMTDVSAGRSCFCFSGSGQGGGVIASPEVYFCCFSSDLTGAQDGSVRMFEWGHSQQIICFRSPGNSRVTRIRFNHQGNKVRTSRSSCTSWAEWPHENPAVQASLFVMCWR